MGDLVTQFSDRSGVPAPKFVLRCNFSRCFPIQYLSRVAVHPVLDSGYFFICDGSEVSTLGKEPAYDPVVSFVGSFFPGCIRVTVIYLEAFVPVNRSAESFVVDKLSSVVCSDGFEFFPEFRILALHVIKYPYDRICFSVR